MCHLGMKGVNHEDLEIEKTPRIPPDLSEKNTRLTNVITELDECVATRHTWSRRHAM